jgi:pimeloyl-ACP methyl ester carboxylesterase
MTTVHVTHARTTLALHELKSGEGRPLLHLHGLGLRSPETLPADVESWPGPVYGLDFTGHGGSTIPTGGGYTPEVLIGDVDAAIQHLGGEVTLVGRGLGAYVALLVAGARPDAVRGAILCDGPGIAGGGPAPGTPQAIRVDPEAASPPDPWAVAELSKDIRPPDYAVDFARLASANAHPPLALVAKARPEWLVAVAEEVGAAPMSLDDALRSFSKR